MASDRHGKHNKPTIAFRVTPYEQQVINERVKASGMKKQDSDLILSAPVSITMFVWWESGKTWKFSDQRLVKCTPSLKKCPKT